MRQSPQKRGYDGRWQKARLSFLASNPWCVYCARQGMRCEAVQVDHIRPHRGDMRLFWDASNWQGLCDTHHRVTKAREEASGHRIGAGLDGRPIDPRHPWNRRG